MNTHPTTIESLSYSIADVCKVSGLNRTSIFQEIRKGNLKARKFGRRTIILRGDLEHFLQQLPVANA